MDVTYLLPCRNKRDKIELALKSTLLQTYPCRIVISDQGSTDGTWEFIQEYVRQFRHRKEVHLVQCPLIPPYGMSAFNVHINWLMSHIREGVILIASGDDVTHADRTAKVVECFEKHDPAIVLTAQEFHDPSTGATSQTAFQEEAQMLTGEKILKHLIGGSASMAWTAEFFHKVGGCHGIVGIDVFLPFLAAQDKGCWWCPEVLHCYMNYADDNNMGLGGVLRAANGDEKRRKQIAELIQYQMCAVATALASKAEELYPDMRIEDRLALFSDIGSRAYGWSIARNTLTQEAIQPLSMAQ